MTKRITRTQLNQQTARVLARVAAGERLTITDRGRPIAEIVPTKPSRWDELVGSGRVSPPREAGPLPFRAVEHEASTKSMIDDVRTDRG